MQNARLSDKMQYTAAVTISSVVQFVSDKHLYFVPGKVNKYYTFLLRDV